MIFFDASKICKNCDPNRQNYDLVKIMTVSPKIGFQVVFLVKVVPNRQNYDRRQNYDPVIILNPPKTAKRRNEMAAKKARREHPEHKKSMFG